MYSKDKNMYFFVILQKNIVLFLIKRQKNQIFCIIYLKNKNICESIKNGRIPCKVSTIFYITALNTASLFELPPF
jgi:hypothetical protein